jgi:hypothetical protein
MKSSILANSVAVAAIIMASVLLSGKAEINLQHHMNLPAEMSNKNTIEVTHPRHFFNDWFGIGGAQIDIRLSNEIKGTDTVKDIGRVLQEAKEGDTVIIHIVGVGGQVDTVMYLINNIKATKAHTIMMVEGPSYSGHAYIAAAGNELHMLPYSFLMYHTSSGYGTDCSKQKGTDRTVPNSEHCQAFMDTHLYEVKSYLDSIFFLTKFEKLYIQTGHDVYITAEEYHKRTGM